MKLFSALASPPVQGRRDLDTRPELWVPDHLTHHYETVAERSRESITPITHSDWNATLSGANRMSLSDRPVKGALWEHLYEALAHLRFGGTAPGSVRHPGAPAWRQVWVPARLQSGETSKYFSEPQMMNEPSAEHRKAMDLYAWSEQHRAEFQALVESTEQDVLADGHRAWDAYVHITLVQAAASAYAKEVEAAERDKRKRALHECPVCLQLNGAVDDRDVEPDFKPRGFAKRLRIRSCLACWHEVRHQQEERRRVERLTDGRTRAERIAEWLDAKAEPTI